MARRKVWAFTVEGKGLFPFDMLRYDRCWPAAEQESSVIEGTTRPHAWSREATVRLRGLNEPTDARWESFGWKVTEAGDAGIDL